MPNFDDAAVQAASSKRAEKPATEFWRGLNVMFLIDLISEQREPNKPTPPATITAGRSALAGEGASTGTLPCWEVIKPIQ